MEVFVIAVTIQDVAKRAGVSISTVSRVVNGYVHVSSELREKVESAIKELEYRPSQVARSLASQKTNLIGIIVPDLTYHYYANMISSIEEQASLNGYNIVVCNIKEDLKKEKKYIHVLMEMWAQGIILMHEKMDPSTKKLLKDSKIPTVLASVKIDGLDIPNVNIDDYKAAYDATEFLIKNGHKRIGFISGDMRDITAGRQRYEGYVGALRDYKLKADLSIIKEGNFQIEDGYNKMAEIMKVKDKPTAVFAVSDSMAIGAMNYAIDQGYRVPEDISIMGFDNIDLAQVIRPRLTTVNQPSDEIGKRALITLIDLIEGRRTDKQIIIDHSIVEGQTYRNIN